MGDAYRVARFAVVAESTDAARDATFCMVVPVVNGAMAAKGVFLNMVDL